MERPAILRQAFRLILILVPLAVLGNIIYTLVFTDRQSLAAIAGIDLGWLGVAVVFSLLPWLFAMARMHVWSRFFNLRLSTRQLAEAVVATDVASITTPTAIGGGYAKIGILIFHKVNPGLAASLTMIGSIEEYVMMAIFVPIGWWLFAPESMSLGPLLAGLSDIRLLYGLLTLVAIVACCILALRKTPRLRARFRRRLRRSRLHAAVIQPISKSAHDFTLAFKLISKGGKRFFALNILLAAIQWGMRYSVFTAIAAGMGLSPDPMTFLLLQWMVFMVIILVPTPGAIGGAEMAFMLIFKEYLPAGMLGAAASAWRLVATYLQLLVGAALMLYFEKPSLKKHASPSEEKPSIPEPTVVDIQPVALGTTHPASSHPDPAKTLKIEHTRLTSE